MFPSGVSLHMSFTFTSYMSYSHMDFCRQTKSSFLNRVLRGPLACPFSIISCCKHTCFNLSDNQQGLQKLDKNPDPDYLNQVCRSRERWKTGKTAALKFGVPCYPAFDW